MKPVGQMRPSADVSMHVSVHVVVMGLLWLVLQMPSDNHVPKKASDEILFGQLKHIRKATKFCWSSNQHTQKTER
jgi:hypothetical protein